MIKNEWMCYCDEDEDRKEKKTKTQATKYIKPCHTIGNFIDYVLGDDFLVQWQPL